MNSSTALSKTRVSNALLHVKSAILVAFHYAFKAYNPQRIWSHFSGISAFTRNTCHTPGYTKVTWASKKLLKNQEFENRTFDCTFFFVWVRLSSIAELNRTQFTDWVRLSSNEFDWVRLKFSSIGFDLLSRDISDMVSCFVFQILIDSL